MANIFQQSLEQIPVKGYVPTTQRDTATPELIATIGKEARAVDIAREESLFRGSSADEVPMADVWQYQELPGPVRPGEAPPVMPIRTEVFDASAELNLNQIVKARQQGLMTPAMAETRANAALRRAINRRPGRQAELTQAYNDFLGVYSGITEETETERMRADEAKRQAAIEDHFIKKYGMDAETGIRWQREQTIQEMQEFRTDVPSRSAADMYARQAETMISNKLNQVFSLPVGEQQQALAALQIDFTSIKGEFLNRYGQMAREAGWKDDFVRKDTARLASRIDDMMKQAGDTNISNMFQKGMNAVKGYSDMQTAKELPPVVWSIMTKLPPDDVGRIIAVANKMKDAGPGTAEYEQLKNDHKFYGIYADMIVRGQSASEIQKRFEQDTSAMVNHAGPDHPFSMTPQVAGQLSNRMAASDNTSETDKFMLDKRTINLGLRDPMALEFVLDPDFIKRVNSNPALKNHLIGVVNTQYLALKNAINDDRLIEKTRQERQGYFGMQKSTGAGGAMAEVFTDEISAYMNNKYRESLHTLFKVQDLYNIAPDLDQAMPSESAQKKSPKVSDTMTSTTDFIAEQEGYRDIAYQDSAGVWTIGYGTTRGVKEGDTITKEQAKANLTQDIKSAEDAVDRLVKVPISPDQRTALVSLIYNVGAGAFERSNSLKLLNAGDYEGFAEGAFGEHGFVNAGGKRIPGLVNRRKRERKLFEGVV